MNDIEKIELRSEKVRKVIGDIPSGIISYGISIITIILLILFLICYSIPYEGEDNIFEYFKVFSNK